MSCWLLFVIPLSLAFAWAKNKRRVLGLSLIAVLTVTLVFPVAGYAQFGLFGGIQNLLNLINGSIRGALNGIGSVMQAIGSLHDQIVWPVRLIQQARTAINSWIAQFRGALWSIHTLPVNSATLPAPSTLEATVRNGQTNDFAALTQAFYRTYGAIPSAADADPVARNLIDADDAMALGALKAVKASDRSADLILLSGDQLEDEARTAAPGSAPFLTAASVAANVQSQAMMQKLLAAMIRQEAARIAHENSRRKRDSALVAKASQGLSDMMKRR
jgi:hypothetical protein